MASTTIYRKDYLPPSHWVDTVNLTFDLHPTQTHVTSVMTVRPNEKSTTTDLLLMAAIWNFSVSNVTAKH